MLVGCSPFGGGTGTISDGGAISATSAAAGDMRSAAAEGGAVVTNVGDNAAVVTSGPTTARAKELAKSIMALKVHFHHLATLWLHPTARRVWQALGADLRSSGAARLSNLRQEM